MFTPRPEVENSAIISVRIREERERDRERLTRTAWLSPFLADFGPISSSESTTTRLLGGICFGILGSFSSFCFFLFEFDGGWLREEWKTLIARLNRSHNVELIIKIFLVNRISVPRSWQDEQNIFLYFFIELKKPIVSLTLFTNMTLSPLLILAVCRTGVIWNRP